MTVGTLVFGTFTVVVAYPLLALLPAGAFAARYARAEWSLMYS